MLGSSDNGNLQVQMDVLLSSAVAKNTLVNGMRRCKLLRKQASSISLFLLGSCLLVRPVLASDALSQTCNASLEGSSRAVELRRNIMVSPSVAAYDALGSLYASVHQNECAISEFQSALKLDPNSKEAKYDLALALRLEGKLEEAQTLLQVLARANPGFALAHEARGEILLELKRSEDAREEFEVALHLDERLTAASEGLVQLSLSQQRPQAAIYWARRALSLKPDPEAEYRLKLSLGTAQGEAADYDGAARTLGNLAAAYPDRIDPHLNLAIVETHLQKYLEATKEFGRVLQLDSNYDVARLALAQADLMANRPNDALQSALVYTSHVPKDAKGFSTLAQAYQIEGQFSQAVAAYKQSMALKPGNYELLFGLGMCQMEGGQKANALESFEAAERIDPSQPAVHYEVFKLLSANKFKDSQDHARQELAVFKHLNSEDRQSAKSSLLGAQANTDIVGGNPQKAVALYRQILDIDPNDAKSHYNLSLVLGHLGDRKGEVKELRAAIALDPKMARAFNRLGLYELQAGNYKEAIQDFQTVLETHPASTDAQINLATVYAKMGRNSEAEMLFRDAISAAPDSLPAQLDLGLLLAAEGKMQEALVPLEAAATSAPSDPKPLTLLGIIHGKLGQSSQSIEYLKKALLLSPNSVNAHFNLGVALADGLDLHGAAEQFAEAEKLAPSAAIVHYNAGRVAFDQGDPVRARRELDRACALQQGYAGALQLLAQLDLNENHPEQAVIRLRQVLALQPQSANAEYFLGRALANTGNRQDAVAQWQLALNNNPGDTRLYWALAHELPPSDPHRRLYLERLQAIQGGERDADKAKVLADLAIRASGSHEWTDAVEKMDDAIRTCGICPLQASLEQKLGLIYGQQGEMKKAEQALRRSLEINPKSPQAKEELVTVERLQIKR